MTGRVGSVAQVIEAGNGPLYDTINSIVADVSGAGADTYTTVGEPPLIFLRYRGITPTLLEQWDIEVWNSVSGATDPDVGIRQLTAGLVLALRAEMVVTAVRPFRDRTLPGQSQVRYDGITITVEDRLSV